LDAFGGELISLDSISTEDGLKSNVDSKLTDVAETGGE